jgi:hypothetical protein
VPPPRAGGKLLTMLLPKEIELEPDARLALGQILGIMSDQAMSGEPTRWDIERLMEIEARLGVMTGAFEVDHLDDTATVTLGIDDAALLLDGMAFTEVASADLPWIDMVRWTADFVTSELRSHWSEVRVDGAVGRRSLNAGSDVGAPAHRPAPGSSVVRQVSLGTSSRRGKGGGLPRRLTFHESNLTNHAGRWCGTHHGIARLRRRGVGGAIGWVRIDGHHDGRDHDHGP